MMTKFKGLHKTASILVPGIIFLLGYVVKCSFIIGSKSAFFSYSNSISPLSGLGGLLGAGGMFLMQLLLSSITVSFSGVLFLAHIPTLCASLYWIYRSKYMARIIFSIAAVLFFVHPIGRYAMVYTVLWIIPCALTFVKRSSVAITALISTFIAHAVGSVIWLYTHAITVEQWKSLLIVVPFERICFAALMVLAYHMGIIYIRLFQQWYAVSVQKIKGLVG